jgi:hypothetical protein
MSTLTPSQLAVLALVGSDASYSNPNIPYPFGPTRDNPNLQSYPDSAKYADEYQFPDDLSKPLPNDLGLATFFEEGDFRAPAGKVVNRSGSRKLDRPISDRTAPQ